MIACRHRTSVETHGTARRRRWLAVSAATFSIRREDAGRVPVFVVEGDVDLQTGPQLSATVCASGGGEHVVVDLCEVAVIDARGLRDMLLAARLLARGLYVVCAPDGPVRRMLETAGARAVFDSRAEALSAVRARRGQLDVWSRA